MVRIEQNIFLTWKKETLLENINDMFIYVKMMCLYVNLVFSYYKENYCLKFP